MPSTHMKPPVLRELEIGTAKQSCALGEREESEGKVEDIGSRLEGGGRMHIPYKHRLIGGKRDALTARPIPGPMLVTQAAIVFLTAIESWSKTVVIVIPELL